MKRIVEEIRALPRGPGALRAFGLMMGCVCILAALVAGFVVGAARTALVLGTVGGAWAVAALVVPHALKPVYYPWMMLAMALGFVMTRALLTLVFFLVITPIGLLMRLFGQDPMQRQLNQKAKTYWIPKAYDPDSRKRLEQYY